MRISPVVNDSNDDNIIFFFATFILQAKFWLDNKLDCHRIDWSPGIYTQICNVDKNKSDKQSKYASRYSDSWNEVFLLH